MYERPIYKMIDAERTRRLVEGPYHYWKVRGDDGPPTDGHGNVREFWCGYCAGYYGVSHDGFHDGGVCRNIWRPHQCACIDCKATVSFIQTHVK